MPLFKQFVRSLYSSKHIAAFRLQGIGKTIRYLFMLALVLSIPAAFYTIVYTASGSRSAQAIMEQKLPMLTMNNQIASVNEFIFIPVIFIIYYLLLSCMLFVKTCVFAGIGLAAVRLMKKRAEYRHLFRMSAYALTLPAAVTTLLELTGFSFSADYLVDWLLTSISLFLSLRFLPGQPK